MRILDA